MAGRRAGCARSRWRSTRPAAATGRSPTSSRPPWRTSSPARRCWSSSAAGRPSASSLPRQRGRRRSRPKPIADRIRADGPLLPLLTLGLARWIAGHYLAPPALVLRAMLPPGLLERLDLVAELAPAAAGPGPAPGVADDPADADLLAQLERGPRPVRDLAGPDGRAGLLRRLRAMATTGRVSLEWTLSGAGSGPRYERWIGLSAAGRDAYDVAGTASRGPAPARTSPDRRAPRARCRARRGGARGGPRRPAWPRSDRGARPARTRRRGGPRATATAVGHPARGVARRPSADERSPARPGGGGGVVARRDPGPRSSSAPARWRHRRWQDRDLRGGDRRVARGGPAGARPGPRDRPGTPARRPAAGGSRRAGRPRPLGSRRRRARRRVAAHPGRRRGYRRRDAAGRRRPAWPTSGSSSSTRSTIPPTRATERRGSRRAM